MTTRLPPFGAARPPKPPRWIFSRPSRYEKIEISPRCELLSSRRLHAVVPLIAGGIKNDRLIVKYL